MYQTGCSSHKFYGLPKFHKANTPLNPQFPAGVQLLKVTLQPGECLCSYDVTALFTSVPADLVLNIIQGLLQQDTSLHNRTVLPLDNIIQLLGVCLHNTYFSFQGQFYEQLKEPAMGSLVSPIVANLYMEHFQRTALRTATTPTALAEIDMRITPLSSNRKNINRTFWNTSITWTLPSGSMWKTTAGLYHFQTL